MIRLAPGMADRLVRLALALISIGLASSCGSGAVGPSTVVNDPAQITIQPGQCTGIGSTVTCNNPAILYSGLPTTFVITGGTGSYILSSNNQSVLPVSGNIVGNSVTLFPSPVLVDTDVILTARDTGATPIATAKATVKPGTVANNITITPTSTQAGSCAPAICSGGDAIVSATLAQGGNPLPARGVRFDVVTGDFRFVTTDPATGVETLSASVIVISDQAGKVTARFRVNAGAANQTALLQVTDFGTSAFQRASFVIAQSTGSSPGFFVTPTQVTFQGARLNECANSGTSANVAVFGGVPPYTVSNATPFLVSPSSISSSGGSYSVTPNGTCVAAPGASIVVTDSAGHTATTTVANIPGTQAPPTLTVSPTDVTLSSCTGMASVTVAGGAPTTPPGYLASPGSDAIDATPTGNTVSIKRHDPSPAQSTTDTVSVGISDGITTTSVKVHFVGEGAGPCPPLSASPTSVVLSDCTSPVPVTLSGGSGTYSATSNDPRVKATVSGSILSIKRSAATGAFGTGEATTVTATDGFSNKAITVKATSFGSNACP